MFDQSLYGKLGGLIVPIAHLLRTVLRIALPHVGCSGPILSKATTRGKHIYKSTGRFCSKHRWVTFLHEDSCFWNTTLLHLTILLKVDMTQNEIFLRCKIIS